MQISVIIPSYKPQFYIWECLDSLKHQDYNKQNFEIVIILNGCCEPYFSELKSYISSNLYDFSVTLLQTDIAGVSNARNIGIEKSRGDYITFIDDDDYVSTNFLSALASKVEQNLVPISNMKSFVQGDDIDDAYYVALLFKKVSSLNKVPILKARTYLSFPVAKLIDRAIIKDRRFDKRFKNGEDSLFMLSISDNIKYLRPTSKDAIYYRRYRVNSAFTRKQNRKDVIKNKIKLGFAYLPYLLQPWRYNFIFCLTRILALFK